LFFLELCLDFVGTWLIAPSKLRDTFDNDMLLLSLEMLIKSIDDDNGGGGDDASALGLGGCFFIPE
jgi:hypothetical protein